MNISSNISKPTTYKLNTPPFLDPRIFRAIWGKTYKVTTGSRGVDIDGTLFTYDGPAPEVGTVVLVTLGQWATYQIKTEVDAWDAIRMEKINQQKEAMRQKSIQRRLEAEAQHQDLASFLPFKYTAGIKDVLSGLSASSWGDGRKANTVQHILLLEPYDSPRLSRRHMDFLCTNPAGSNGKNWTDNKRETWVDDDNKEYTAPITCKLCLRQAEALRKRQVKKQEP